MSSNHACVVDFRAEAGPGRTPLQALIERLRRAASFEQAAAVLLDEVLEICDATARPRYQQSIVQRGILHLRPGGGYQGLIVRSYGPARELDTAGEATSSDSPASDPSWMSSLTAWKYVSQGLAPFEIDVARGQVTRLFQEKPGGVGARPEPSSFEGQRTLSVMRARRTTHLLVLPMKDVRGAILGQVCVEVQCTRGIASPYVWMDCLGELFDVLSVAAPYVTALPVETQPATAAARDFPVVGPTMDPILRTLRIFSRHNETILLRGATGTGKSRLARWCHGVSERARQPFIVVTLNAVPSELQPSTLFGWKRGAFTGATSSGAGAVQRAQGGTLFLDEIDKLDLSAQKSLLRLLEEKQFQPIGGDKDEEADVRFIVGTNADLEKATREGHFLVDLYYRINVLPVRLPPLCERGDEVLSWAEFMTRRCARELAEGVQVQLAADVRELVLSFHWPGNLRQLDNVMRRAVLFALPEPMGQAQSGAELCIERRHVEAALRLEGVLEPAAPTPNEALSSLESAARAIVKRLRAGKSSGPTDPGLLELLGTGFRALVLLEAVAQWPDLKEALLAVGKEKLYGSRNHQRALQSARNKVQQLQLCLRKA